ncbi:MAG: ABC transporter ATP-binding protein [Lactococcus sp.]
MQAIIELKNATVIVDNGTEKKIILDQVSLSIFPQDFITIVGGNGAGKSTLFNVISGNLMLTEGKIFILGHDMTKKTPQARSKYLARVFQDPKMGTAPRMTVLENLAVAQLRGKKRGLKITNTKNIQETFLKKAEQIGNGLENHLTSPTGNLSGGQRQVLSLLMATLQKPELLLLDEHTAALDPKTSKAIMVLTNNVIKSEQLTSLMITHQMEDALRFGNRLLVMKSGKIVKDINSATKSQMKLEDFYRIFE